MLNYSGVPVSTKSTLPALGCAVVGGDPSSALGSDVFGGTFVGQYNGGQLSAGIHVIIEDRSCLTLGAPSICVTHPWGADTQLLVALPLAWQHQGAAPSVVALNTSGAVVGTVPSHLSGGAFIAFDWLMMFSGEAISAYAVIGAHSKALEGAYYEAATE